MGACYGKASFFSSFAPNRGGRSRKWKKPMAICHGFLAVKVSIWQQAERPQRNSIRHIDCDRRDAAGYSVTQRIGERVLADELAGRRVGEAAIRVDGEAGAG